MNINKAARIANVTMNGQFIGIITANNSPGSTPWGITHIMNEILDLCSERGLRMIGNAFDVEFYNGSKWSYYP